MADGRYLFGAEYALQLGSGPARRPTRSSFRRSIIRDTIVGPPASHHNRDRLAERTIPEVRLFEMCPVNFAAYRNTTAMEWTAVR